MQRLRFFGLVLMVPALAFLASGCGGGSSPTKSGTTTPSPDKGSSGASAKKEMTALTSKGTATLKGQVTYDGDPPKPATLPIAENHQDAAKCKKGDTTELIWEVDPNSKGVKNVVVWVRAGENKYFDHASIPDALKKRTDSVVLGQPFCNYQPHVLAYNPSIFDGKKQQPTGMKFVATNKSDGIGHNVKWEGNPGIPGNADNKNVSPGQELEIVLKPARDERTGDDIVKLACNVHTWMTGRVLVLDTPYFAVTDKDGKFEIKDVPAGAEVHVLAFHEEAGDSNNFVLPEDKPSRQGKTMTLDAGKDGTLNFKIKKK